jgi:hypothetical protein
MESNMNQPDRYMLAKLAHPMKQILIAMLVTLTIGVTLGLVTVFFTTTGQPDGIISHYQGDAPSDIDLIPDKYPMPVKELLITTHNHILSFTFIFGFLAFLIQMSSMLSSRLKQVLALEPFLSIILTFGSMWGIRFISGAFVWLMLLSSVILYLSFYIMIAIIIWELFRNNSSG